MDESAIEKESVDNKGEYTRMILDENNNEYSINHPLTNSIPSYIPPLFVT